MRSQEKTIFRINSLISEVWSEKYLIYQLWLQLKRNRLPKIISITIAKSYIWEITRWPNINKSEHTRHTRVWIAYTHLPEKSARYEGIFEGYRCVHTILPIQELTCIPVTVGLYDCTILFFVFLRFFILIQLG